MKLIDIKSTSGNTKSSNEIVKNEAKYHINKCIKFGEYNIGENEKILTLPYYIAFMLNE